MGRQFGKYSFFETANEGHATPPLLFLAMPYPNLIA